MGLKNRELSEIYLRLYMDSSSFANIPSLTCRYDCSRIFGLLLLRPSSGKDHNGLFARRLPIAVSGSWATDILGFCRRRFDL